MKLRQGVAPGLLSLVFGPGFGLAAQGRFPRAFAWLAALFAGLIATAFSIWLFALVVLVYIGAAVDAYVVAARDEDYNLRSLQRAIIIPFVVIGIALVARTFVLEAFRIPSSSMSPTLVIGDHLFIDKLISRFSTPSRGDVVVFRQPCDGSRDYVERVVGLPGDTVEIRCSVLYINGTAVPQHRLPGSCAYPEHDEESGPTTRPCTAYTEELGGHTYTTLFRPDRPEHPSIGFGDAPREEASPSCEFNLGEDRDERIPRIVTTPAYDQCAPHAHFIVPDDSVFTLGDSRDNSNDSRYWGAVPIDRIKGRVIGSWSPLGRFGPVP